MCPAKQGICLHPLRRFRASPTGVARPAAPDAFAEDQKVDGHNVTLAVKRV